MMESTKSIALTPSREVIEAILSGPDYFTCERTHTRMKKAHCIKRQTEGLWSPGNIRSYREIPPECQGCEQGKSIAQSAKSIAQSEKEEGEMEGKDICTYCGKEIKAGEQKVKGMHKRPCYDKKWREDHPPQSAKRKAPSAERRAPREVKDHSIILHFEEYPDLLEQLKTQAQEEFRTIDMQILYLLKGRPGRDEA